MSRKLLHCLRMNLPYLRYRMFYYRCKYHTSTRVLADNAAKKLFIGDKNGNNEITETADQGKCLGLFGKWLLDPDQIERDSADESTMKSKKEEKSDNSKYLEGFNEPRMSAIKQKNKLQKESNILARNQSDDINGHVCKDDGIVDNGTVVESEKNKNSGFFDALHDRKQPEKSIKKQKNKLQKESSILARNQSDDINGRVCKDDGIVVNETVVESEKKEKSDFFDALHDRKQPEKNPKKQKNKSQKESSILSRKRHDDIDDHMSREGRIIDNENVVKSEKKEYSGFFDTLNDRKQPEISTIKQKHKHDKLEKESSVLTRNRHDDIDDHMSREGGIIDNESVVKSEKKEYSAFFDALNDRKQPEISTKKQKHKLEKESSVLTRNHHDDIDDHMSREGGIIDNESVVKSEKKEKLGFFDALNYKKQPEKSIKKQKNKLQKESSVLARNDHEYIDGHMSRECEIIDNESVVESEKIENLGFFDALNMLNDKKQPEKSTKKQKHTLKKESGILASNGHDDIDDHMSREGGIIDNESVVESEKREKSGFFDALNDYKSREGGNNEINSSTIFASIRQGEKVGFCNELVNMDRFMLNGFSSAKKSSFFDDLSKSDHSIEESNKDDRIHDTDITEESGKNNKSCFFTDLKVRCDLPVIKQENEFSCKSQILNASDAEFNSSNDVTISGNERMVTLDEGEPFTSEKMLSNQNCADETEADDKDDQGRKNGFNNDFIALDKAMESESKQKYKRRVQSKVSASKLRKEILRFTEDVGKNRSYYSTSVKSGQEDKIHKACTVKEENESSLESSISKMMKDLEDNEDVDTIHRSKCDSTDLNISDDGEKSTEEDEQNTETFPLKDYTSLIHEEFRSMSYIEELGLRSSIEDVRLSSGEMTDRLLKLGSDEMINLSTVTELELGSNEENSNINHSESEYDSSTLLSDHDEEEAIEKSVSSYGQLTEISVDTSDMSAVNDEVEDHSQQTIPEDALLDTDELPSELAEEEEDNEYPIVFQESAPVKPSFNLAPYVDKSEVLTNLVKLGVDLSAIEKSQDAADMLVKLDYERDVVPRLFFLKDVGIADDEIGHVITKNPFIFNESMDNLHVRINYFKSKRFTPEDITNIVKRASPVVSMSVKEIDKVLGMYQKIFKLKGDELRAAVHKFPQLIFWDPRIFKQKKFHFKEVLGFTEVELKELFIKAPRTYAKCKKDITRKFDFLHNVMGLSHSRLIQYPNVFRCRLFILKQRHQYLVSLGRAQYDPSKENYVSLHHLVTGKDSNWCFEVAKTSVEEFNNFLKTL